MTKQKSNFLLLHIWSLPNIMQHHTPHLDPQQSQTDAGSLNYHRACQLPIMPEEHRQSKADATRGMHTTSVLPTSCSIHLVHLFRLFQMQGVTPPDDHRQIWSQTDAAYIWEPSRNRARAKRMGCSIHLEPQHIKRCYQILGTKTIRNTHHIWEHSPLFHRYNSG